MERARRDTRMNDGACDSRGRLWAGTMSLAGDTRSAALYRLAIARGWKAIAEELWPSLAALTLAGSSA